MVAAQAASVGTLCLSKTPVIAIVDDDDAVREALLDLLQVEGYSGRAFGSAAEFLAGHASSTFAAVITDVRMPGIDGLEMQQRLRALGSDIPVIFVTSATDRATRAQALAGGAIGYLTKPVANDALLNLLQSAVALDSSSADSQAGRQPPES